VRGDELGAQQPPDDERAEGAWMFTATAATTVAATIARRRR
jgi:hypothetical protein